MKIETYIDSLVAYAIRTGLAEPCDKTVLRNRLLDLLRLDNYEPAGEPLVEDLPQILEGILADCVERGLCADDIISRDIFDTRLMGALTPMPREVTRLFREKYAQDPAAATDWYYKLSGDTNYIRRDRIAKDMRWVYGCEYGDLDITINLSKPEKDPKAIAAAKNAPQVGYPKCQLCPENEGYAGHLNHPARANHRVIPIEICGEDWCLQYSPYVYYNEHCIVFNSRHVPMKIDRAAFEKLLDFVRVFPHYFVGSNADLPIVGGSILSHEHFQGGHYTFAMERAPVETAVTFAGYDDIQAGIVKWPMSVIRLTGPDRGRIADLAETILNCWRSYSDESAGILAQTHGEPHNTITPIARRRGEQYELDLVLRCNITSPEHPLGVFHPHADKHHIKKENIGLIEVMGLAVLPSRLKRELHLLADAIDAGRDISADEALAKHAPWVQELRTRHSFDRSQSTLDILLQETGRVFAAVLEDAGVYKNTPAGRAAFARFVDAVNRELTPSGPGKKELHLYMSRWALHGGAPGLALFGFDPETGAIRLKKELDSTHSFGCSHIDREKGILYLCNETNLKDETGYDTGRIYGYRIDPASGDLTELFRQDTYCPFPDYLGFTEDHGHLIVPHHSWASGVTTIQRDENGTYHPVVRWMDSAIDLFRMAPDGTAAALVDVCKHRCEGSIMLDYEQKVTIPHPHCAVRSPDGKFFAVCDKGTCKLYLYKIENERLVLLSSAMTEEPLSEPRYCAFHPTAPYLFVNHEHTGHGRMVVSAFRYDENGTLSPIDQVDCLPEGCSVRSEGQGFCISADGRFLYNQICGLNAMVVLSIDQDTGKLRVIQHVPILGTRPRACALSPDGRFLITTCLGGEIAVYAVNPDGTLSPTGHKSFLKGSSYISFY